MSDFGWVKVHRELLDKAIWKLSTPEQKVVLITILMLANHSSNQWEFEGKKFVCKAGQFVTSLNSLAEYCGKGVSVQNVRSALDRFERYEFITNKSTNTGRLITVVNWDKYQDKSRGSKQYGAGYHNGSKDKEIEMLREKIKELEGEQN